MKAPTLVVQGKENGTTVVTCSIFRGLFLSRCVFNIWYSEVHPGTRLRRDWRSGDYAIARGVRLNEGRAGKLIESVGECESVRVMRRYSVRNGLCWSKRGYACVKSVHRYRQRKGGHVAESFCLGDFIT